MNALERPRTLDELFSIYRPGMEFVAGGSDWVIKNHGRLAAGTAVADLSLLAELKGISLEGGFLRIGAMETMTNLHRCALVRKYAAALADAAYVMGSEQIRNRATVGGNVANASPAADTPPALAALAARAVVASKAGERSASIEEVLGRDQSSLAAGEIIKEFIIPADAGRLSAFLKLGSRSQVSISRVNLAVSAKRGTGHYEEASVYVGTLGTAARRCAAAESALAAPDFADGFSAALRALAAEAIPGRSTLPYKRSALRALAQDILSVLADRAKEGADNE